MIILYSVVTGLGALWLAYILSLVIVKPVAPISQAKAIPCIVDAILDEVE